MKRPSLALLILLFLCTVAHGQSLARKNHNTPQIIEDATADQVVAARAIFLLKQLDEDVIVYRSLGEFEESRKLARVSFEAFRNSLQSVTEEVEPIMLRLPQSRMKTEIRNALDSYRDGALFWWQQIDQARVVDVSKMSFNEYRNPPEKFLRGTVPYTVAIHWRQARKHLRKAAALIKRDTQR